MFCKNCEGGQSCCSSLIFIKRIFLIIIVAIGAIFWYIHNSLVLAVTGSHFSQALPVEGGEEWQIVFTHSVERTPWEEYYRVEDGGNLLYKTRFQSLGWGYPYSQSDGEFHATKDGFELLMERKYPVIKLMVAPEASPVLLHRGQKYNLCEIYGDREAVEIRPVSRLRYIITRLTR